MPEAIATERGAILHVEIRKQLKIAQGYWFARSQQGHLDLPDLETIAEAARRFKTIPKAEPQPSSP